MEETNESGGSLRSPLPWIAGLGALVLYLLTLNRWMSIGSLPLVSTLTDPAALLPVTSPLSYLLTWVCHLLPAPLQLPALHCLTAVLAAATLLLLARSVMLLPHDRTREERHRHTGEFALFDGSLAWIPPVFAVLLCGLQISFWEHATAATGEMLDLLLFAYVIKSLLEYRLDENESRLTRLSFVYGLATTNNWAMIGFFPLVLGAVIWIRGRAFFQARFLLRMTAWGAVGLTPYFLLPMLHALEPQSSLSFWQVLRTELGLQKQMLLGMPRIIALIGALTSVVPAILIGIRWPSSFGDTTAVGNILSNYVFRAIYAVLLAAIAWVALGSPISPRTMFSELMQRSHEPTAGLGYLTFYYLGALSAGYLLGYYLLLFSRPERSRRRPSSSNRFLGQLATVVLCMGAAGVAGTLAWRNYPAMRSNNGLILKEFASLQQQGLPAQPSVILSDQPHFLTFQQALLREARSADKHLLVSTRMLQYTPYQQLLRRRAPTVWPSFASDTNTPAQLDKVVLTFEMAAIAASNRVVYLHPSFGYYFEMLYSQPMLLAYPLTPYGTNLVTPPPLAPAVLQTNQAFWTALQPRLQRLIPLVRQGHTDAVMAGRWYSRALNLWGVTLQRQPGNHLREAAPWFDLATQLDPENRVAIANLEYSRSVQAGTPRRVDATDLFQKHFGSRYRDWSELLLTTGPVDEPVLCLELGREFFLQSLHRQAAAEFRRALSFEPGNPQVRLALGLAYNAMAMHDLVLETVRGMPTPASAEDQAQVAVLESVALRGQNKPREAERLLLATLARLPTSRLVVDALLSLYQDTARDDDALSLIQEQLKQSTDVASLLLNKAVICMRLQQYPEAEEALRQILSRQPDQPQALLTQGALFIQTRRFTNALAPLNRLLETQPQNDAARLNRAISLLQSGQLDAAAKDYEILVERAPSVFAIHYGLAEIAWQKKDRAAALRHYENYLRLAPPGSAESKAVAVRVQELKSAKP